MYTPTLLTDLLYVQYLYAIWLSSKNDLPILTPLPTVHSYIYIYIYIYVSHMTVTYSHWLPSWGTYNLCKLHSLICMCSDMRSGCHSLSDCTFLYKYGYETIPRIVLDVIQLGCEQRLP